jgi:NAD(P)-dependent dehydrogenase (short-subunit alcohol dehydrogenase family)
MREPGEAMDFKGKVAVITGGANGMGRATALGFARCGAKVVVVDRDTVGGDGTAGIIHQQGGEALFVAADVTKSTDVQAYVKAALDAYGAIDCFHNNAGIEGSIAPTAEYDEAIFDAVMSVNVKGVFLGLRHVLPVMLRQKRGAIVNTASTFGLVGPPGYSAYVASKHAVIGLTKTAAGEVARSGVRVNAVCPGQIDTPMIHRLASVLSPDDPQGALDRYPSDNIPIGRFGTADEIANLVLFLCSDLASNITGAQYVSDGGRTATGGSVTNNLLR